VVPELTITSVLSDKVPERVSIPALIVVSPVYELDPLKVTVPEPDLIKFPDPDITPEYSAVPDWLKVASPLVREILFSTLAPLEELIEDPPPKLIVPEPDTDPEPVVSTNPPDPDLVIFALMMISLSASKVKSLLLEDDIAEETVIFPS
tara:strand:+ start:49 stop:495 length:447 start_codon:yes stop_codon:yes gene_type:complete